MFFLAGLVVGFVFGGLVLAVLASNPDDPDCRACVRCEARVPDYCSECVSEASLTPRDADGRFTKRAVL